MNSDFKDLLALLNRFGVRYLVVGGYAVMLYTEPRYTKDIDVFVGPGDREISGIGQAFTEFGFPMTAELLDQLKMPNRMISIGRPPSRIDLLNELTGVDFERAWQHRNIVVVDDIEVPFISLYDLVDAKRACGRPQDLLDLKKLEPLI
jgi:hypothetical protein